MNRFQARILLIAFFFCQMSCGLIVLRAVQVPGKPSIPNSTAKLRAKPNSLTAKIGSAIRWESDYAAALEKSKATGKPIFWYVHSVQGTFMDRQLEIDRYMLGGPFSWPSIVALINERFIPLKAIPAEVQAKQFDLQVYKFVEPGFVVIDSNEKVMLLANRLTTLHPQWIFKIVAQSVQDDRSWEQLSGNAPELKVDAIWNEIQSLNWQLEKASVDKMLASNSAELRLLAGMVVFRMGQHDQACKIWEETAQTFPDHPLGWKAACEAQRIGPFYRGFEVFNSVPSSMISIPADRMVTSAAVANSYTEDELWDRGITFLLSMQDESGGFFDSDYDFGGTDSLPNVYVAMTSLVGLALIESLEHLTASEKKQSVRAAIDKAVLFVSNDTNLNFNDRDEVLWAQAYRIRLLSAMRKHFGGDTLQPALQNAVKQLENIQLKSGGWYHEYANSFASATALTALFDASQQGAKVDSDKVNLGLKRLSDQRLSNGAFPYATRQDSNDEGKDSDLAASGGRISVCELARRRWEQIDDVDFTNAVSKSLDHHHLLAKALKYDDHTSTYAYGGFFFWYDMQARSEAISVIQDPAVRRKLADRQYEIIMGLPELDGCFVDSHELGRCYGTAMALLSLSAIKE